MQDRDNPGDRDSLRPEKGKVSCLLRHATGNTFTFAPCPAGRVVYTLPVAGIFFRIDSRSFIRELFYYVKPTFFFVPPFLIGYVVLSCVFDVYICEIVYLD